MDNRFISLSGGVESTTMGILYGKGATAIWCDTGDEEPEMYKRIDDVEKALIDIHEGDFKLIRIYPKVTVKGIECSTIDEAALAWSFFPAPTARWCTKQFKIEPIDEFLIQQGECELMIGLNADEEPGADRTGNFMKCKNVKYTYPLHDDGITRDDCKEILASHNLLPSFPVYMQRGGCKKCFYKKKGELKAKAVFNRDGFIEDMAFEEKLQDKRSKFYYINMNAGCSYREVAEEVDREILMWGEETVRSMYSNVKSHKPCGAFCHR
jgi:3'-phosphoadenosine 5'-phosphosulfate sulfotransferase (PAPS reductase)/FAD synthetase